MANDKMFAKRLRETARARGHTQQDVAVMLNCHTQTVARWWQGNAMPTGLYRSALERYLTEEGAK